MKTKNKVLAIVEIAIVLCSLFLVAIPAIAVEQNHEMQKVSTSANTITTASEDDYVFGIYGNANEDDTIDMRDLTYVKLMFFGKKPETELADAKYDGKINPLDFIQIKLIIVGKEKELTFIDKMYSHSALDGQTKERIVTVKKPVNRVIVTYTDIPQLVKTLNAADKIVGIDDLIKYNRKVLFPEISKLPSIGTRQSPDFEQILDLHPDIILPGMKASWNEAYLEKTPGVTVIYLPLNQITDHVQSVRKLGYIFDKEEEAEEFLQWREGCINKIKERTEGLSEDEKPRVLVLSHFWPGGHYRIWDKTSLFTVMCGIAGGKSILLDGGLTGGVIDPEWVMAQNPDIIFGHTLRIKAGYGTDDPSELVALVEELMNRPELAEVNAVKNGNVYLTARDLYLSGDGQAIGVQYMAKCFQPDLFEDLDLHGCHQEYLDRFQHLDFDLDRQGVFIYPEPS